MKCHLQAKPSNSKTTLPWGAGIFKIIHGFADLRDLVAVSLPYELSGGAELRQVIDYQGQLNEKHTPSIKKYFEQSNNWLIPEVILSVRSVFSNAILGDAGAPI